MRTIHKETITGKLPTAPKATAKKAAAKAKSSEVDKRILPIVRTRGSISALAVKVETADTAEGTVKVETADTPEGTADIAEGVGIGEAAAVAAEEVDIGETAGGAELVADEYDGFAEIDEEWESSQNSMGDGADNVEGSQGEGIWIDVDADEIDVRDADMKFALPADAPEWISMELLRYAQYLYKGGHPLPEVPPIEGWGESYMGEEE